MPQSDGVQIPCGIHSEVLEKNFVCPTAEAYGRGVSAAGTTKESMSLNEISRGLYYRFSRVSLGKVSYVCNIESTFRYRGLRGCARCFQWERGVSR